jgi:hypothetical protein
LVRSTQVNTGFTREPADACDPVAVRGFRVYPPDETTSVFVSQPQTACSAKGKGVGGVAPITLASSS